VSDEPKGVTAFNNSGELTYSDYVLPSFDFHTFVWKDGITTDISGDIDPGAYYVDVQALNDRGDMAGMRSSSSDQTIRSFLYSNGQVTSVEPFSGADAVFVYDLNNRRQIVGTSTSFADQSSVAFVWDAGKLRVLAPLPGSTAASPKAINDHGIVVGRDASGFGVIWREQSPALIPVPSGTESSEAADINDNGDVILQASVNGNDRALYWHNGRTRMLPLLDDSQSASAVFDINELDVMVGATFTEVAGASTGTATLWLGNRAFDLNTLLSDSIPPESRPRLSFAKFINDKGQIVASGPSGTFLLTPHR